MPIIGLQRICKGQSQEQKPSGSLQRLYFERTMKRFALHGTRSAYEHTADTVPRQHLHRPDSFRARPLLDILCLVRPGQASVGADPDPSGSPKRSSNLQHRGPNQMAGLEGHCAAGALTGGSAWERITCMSARGLSHPPSPAACLGTSRLWRVRRYAYASIVVLLSLLP